MIQVRNVPDQLHRKLKVRAAEQGVSLSDYILAELRRVAERLTPRELAERAGAIRATILAVARRALRAERDRRSP